MKRNLLFLALCFCMAKAVAQNYEFSPLSRYGLGDLQRLRSPFSLHMGGAGVAYTHADEFNFSNPASLGFLRITDAELGFYARYNELSDPDENTATDWSGNMSYIQLGIPLFNSINQALERKEVKHPMGISLGISPYSNTGYRYVVRDSGDLGGRTIREQEGQGGLSKFSLGYGYRHGNFGAGLSASYIFGSVQYSQSYRFPDLPGSAGDYSLDKFHGDGFELGLGFIYSHRINKASMARDKSIKAKTLNFGFNLILPAQLGFSRDYLQYSRLNVAGGVVDTIRYEQDSRSTATAPLKLNLGIFYNHKDKKTWMADISYESWGSAKLHDSGKGELADFVRFSAGGMWKPTPTGYARLLNRSQYRYGFFYESGYISSGGKNLAGYGLTAGIAMPFTFQRQLAVINLGIEAGINGISDLISSRYIRINAGVRLNDNEWFLKRRYN